MSDFEEFEGAKNKSIAALGSDVIAKSLTKQWFERVSLQRYSYNFTWLGQPIIQFPQDIIAIQEVIWKVKPDLIIETGIARGGSLMFYASMLELLGGNGIVVGVDVDIRPHNRAAIEAHALSRRIRLVQGSSIDDDTLSQVKKFAKTSECVMVILDSNHQKSHVLNELRLYQEFVRRGSYLIVLDTIIDDMPVEFSANRPWSPGDGPKAAVHEFLKETNRFEIDPTYPDKLLITVAPDGFLMCIRNP